MVLPSLAALVGLPLFVVIGRDGKVASFHAGNYEDTTLTVLDTA